MEETEKPKKEAEAAAMEKEQDREEGGQIEPSAAKVI